MGMSIVRQETISNVDDWLGDIRSVSKKQFANLRKIRALKQYQ